jgi:hypothetical protein
MSTIANLPCFGIVVRLGRSEEGDVSGTISSDLLIDLGKSNKREVDTLESFILAAACAGVDIDSPAFIKAIETTVEAISNH